MTSDECIRVVRCHECVYNNGKTKDIWGFPAVRCLKGETHERNWYCADGKMRKGHSMDDKRNEI